MDGFFSLTTGPSVPIGCILQWYGSANAVPIGWGICNGAIYTRSDGAGSITSPNMMNKIVVGAGNTFSQGSSGGATTQTPVIANTTLTIAQIPSHGHGYSDPSHAHSVYDPTHAHGTQDYRTWGGGLGISLFGIPGNFGNPASGTFASGTGVGLFNATINITIANNGSGSSHGHVGSAMSVVQPYMALYHIIKV
jgi:hypothetical protein